MVTQVPCQLLAFMVSSLCFLGGADGHGYGLANAQLTAKLYDGLHPSMVNASMLTLVLGYSSSRAKHFEPSFVQMVLGKKWLEGDTIPRKMPEVTLPSRTTWTLRVISGACDFR
jgi:hypothetical protein